MKPSLILATQPIDDYCREILGRFGTIRIAQDMKEQTLAEKIQTAVALVARGQAPITRAVSSMSACRLGAALQRPALGYTFFAQIRL